MPLEATMFCLDNSEYMRNGDFNPTRLAAQSEAVHTMINSKIKSNAESAVGFLSMAGNRVDVHMSLSRDLGKILTNLKSMAIGGSCDLVTSLKIAQLILKNRPNKSLRQRIVVFIGSPVGAEASELTTIAAQLKKNSVAVDIVHFGSEGITNGNSDKLNAFINAINNADNSHIITVPPGPHRLSDMVLCSPVMTEGGAAPIASSSGQVGANIANDFDDFGGINAEEDPELALAMRLSMEEASRAATTSASTNTTTTTPATNTATSTAATDAAPGADADFPFDMDDELAAAIALSMELNQEPATSSTNTNNVQATPAPAPSASALETPAPSAQPRTGPAAPKKADASSAIDEEAMALLDDPDVLGEMLREAGLDSGMTDDVLDEIAKQEKKKKDGEDKK